MNANTSYLPLVWIYSLSLFLCLLCVPGPARGDDPPPIDWNRATQLYQREQRGEKLSPDEQAYLDRAKAERQKMQNRAAPAPRPFTGLIPLTDLKEAYKGFEGGLYGAGKNDPPPTLLKAAEAAAASVTPLDREGQPSPNGKIVLLSIGMSNTTQEFSRFKQLADADPRKSARVVIVDGAQGGQDAAAWVDPNRSPHDWETVQQRLEAQGVSARQVQAIWIKQALANPAGYGEFPRHAQKLQADVEQAVSDAHARFVSLRLVYLSSRIYAGYANTPLNPEPYAYEGGFAVRWVIEDQVKALPGDGAEKQVATPVVLWGPYLWADGTHGRNTDALVWNHEDFGPDGTHPSNSGRQKVAGLLLDFFTTDATAKPWYSNPK